MIQFAVVIVIIGLIAAFLFDGWNKKDGTPTPANQPTTNMKENLHRATELHNQLEQQRKDALDNVNR